MYRRPVADSSRDLAFRRRIRETIETLLACQTLRAVRVDLGTDVLAGTKSAEQRHQRLSRLKTSELATITFEFSRKTPTAAAVNKAMIGLWGRQGRKGSSPHYRLLSEIAHVVMSTPLTRSPDLALAMIDFYELRRDDSSLTIPTLDLMSMHNPADERVSDGDPEIRGPTATVPSPSADMIATAFRWARMTVVHARLELGESETNAQLAKLDRLVHRLLRRCIAARPMELVRDTLDDMRRILGRAGLDPPSIDALRAERYRTAQRSFRNQI